MPRNPAARSRAAAISPPSSTAGRGRRRPAARGPRGRLCHWGPAGRRYGGEVNGAELYFLGRRLAEIALGSLAGDSWLRRVTPAARLVLEDGASHPGTTAADICGRTGLQPAQVSALPADLAAQGLLTVSAAGGPPGGERVSAGRSLLLRADVPPPTSTPPTRARRRGRSAARSRPWPSWPGRARCAGGSSTRAAGRGSTPCWPRAWAWPPRASTPLPPPSRSPAARHGSGACR